MMQDIDKAIYVKFKKEGYRIKKYKEHPVVEIEIIVRLGYLDVNRTIAGINEEQRFTFEQTVALFIRNLLTSPPTNLTKFDQLHHECCQDCLASRSTKGAKIHYGQAQKLLNMSLKYLYNEYSIYKRESNIFGFPDNNIEQFFHLPIDRQILDFLTRKCKFNKPTLLPWSQWEYNHYISFQHQLRKRINKQYCPLEIDYMTWNTSGPAIAQAIYACANGN